ncbi:hypothetical protein PHACT_12720 [Pseudohongiella acticola]|uniref:Antitoxin SocA-like Panacea domain-containing protein n=1 Tax=Pseudohongiella acticola TaxID=1524254 RepID=A0A1E8CG70_9GAMM|nr:type II toxin-antitoxin system antitoxin SocA domain-containing protein [Pseudohongiella acticola]OFE11413.1 hypothetical protein PHACT_12720 [Pseudohongiella acticola]
MHSAIAVANKILDLATENGRSVTPMQLIKLVYLCHGWMLGLYGRPLLAENIEAWRYGPVIRSLYAKVKDFRDNPVKGPLKQGLRISAPDETFDEQESDLISQVFEIYGRYSGVALSNLTHESGSPWDVVWKLKGQNSSISNDIISDHYRSLYATAPESAASQ